ncbi:MAG: DUF4369 domain-containing protein [Ferruginibacter sp.]
MKRYSFIVFLFACQLLCAQGYQVTLQAPQYKSGIAYLTYHMGKNLNVQDSAAISNNGSAVFKGKEKLPGGIYAIVFPSKRLSLDFFVDKEQKINIKITDTSNLLAKSVVTGSTENNLYVQYQQYVAVKGKQLQDERAAYNVSISSKDSALHEANYNKFNKELNDYRDILIKKQPKSMMAALLNAMHETMVPNPKPVTRQDSLSNYTFYKKHYWDGISFMDERIIRTPFFLPKLERYYREVVSQVPDSIIKEADYELLLARSCPEMYKYLLNWLTDEYINPKYMGQDAVFVHLFENYHSKGISNWLNEGQMKIINRRAYMLMSNLVGEKAADLEMLDTAGKTSRLYDVNADYTLVVFWDPNCGHCKEQIPQIDSIYNASWKKYKLKVYAVLSPDTETNDKIKGEWVKFIQEHNLADWTNVYETAAMDAANNAAQKPSYRQLYDVTLTPTIYLLDKEKRIIGKKLTWQQLDELIQVKIKTKG